MSCFSVRRRLLIISCLAAFIMMISSASPVRATEGGGNAYPNGADDFMAGALPPPGTYLLDYFLYYRANSFKDKDGHDAMAKFDLNAFVNVFRIVHVTQVQFLGANWAMHVFLPLVYKDVDATFGKDNRSGIGDVIIDPFILGWHWKNFHLTTGLDIYLPTGNYNKDRLLNTSRNYYTLEPIAAVTYLADNGFELTGKFMYDYNFKNDDTDYKSGQEFHFDYTIGYHIDKSWAVGLGGYYYYQTTDDEQYGTTYQDGNKGRVFAVGPQVAYTYKNMSFTLKWQKEFEARNRPQGDNFWLKFTYAF